MAGTTTQQAQQLEGSALTAYANQVLGQEIPAEIRAGFAMGLEFCHVTQMIQQAQQTGRASSLAERQIHQANAQPFQQWANERGINVQVQPRDGQWSTLRVLEGQAPSAARADAPGGNPRKS